MQIINFQDSRPIYEQIVEYYKHLILIGAMESDEQMPSVRTLAMDLATNPNTVQKAYAQLEREGFIYTVKGRGNFVKENTNLVCARQDEICNKIFSNHAYTLLFCHNNRIYLKENKTLTNPYIGRC